MLDNLTFSCKNINVLNIFHRMNDSYNFNELFNVCASHKSPAEEKKY